MQLISRQMQLLLDAVVMAAAFTLAYLLRFEFNLPPEILHNWPIQVAFVVLIQTALLRWSGAHDISWRMFNLYDLPAFLLPIALACIPTTLIRIYAKNFFPVLVIPLSVILMNAWISLSLLVGIRLLRRLAVEHNGNNLRGLDKQKRVILAGAGAAGSLAIRELRQNSAARLNVIGFVDDDPEKANLTIHGKKVLGTAADIPALAVNQKIDEVIITIASASREAIAGIVRICKQAGVTARIIPGFSEIMEGRRKIAALRTVDIEDILGREPVKLDDQDVKDFIRGKVVMITGAGGSIGSEIARQATRYRPAYMILVDRSEFAMYIIDQELRSLKDIPPWRSVIADTGNKERMTALFKEHTVNVVIHAAAYKHVPMMEDNPLEALCNNACATYNLAVLAAEYRVGTFLLISTDKAVNPSSVMGTSKRIAEMFILHLAENNSSTKFMAVRFGNVLGSSGSVIPLFRRQIADGGPVTVTHRDMTRYFMTIPEAVSLVLKSATLGQGGEIFVLDMGTPIRIETLARKMIELSGLEPDKDIRIVYTGLRPGEKLFEELSTDEENAAPTIHPRIFVGRIHSNAGMPIEIFIKECEEIKASGTDTNIKVRELLKRMVPETTLT